MMNNTRPSFYLISSAVNIVNIKITNNVNL